MVKVDASLPHRTLQLFIPNACVTGDKTTQNKIWKLYAIGFTINEEICLNEFELIGQIDNRVICA